MLCSRVFGVKKSAGLDEEEKISSSEFFNRFPKLEAYLLQIIEQGKCFCINYVTKFLKFCKIFNFLAKFLKQEKGAAELEEGKGLSPCLLPSLLIIQR